MKKKEKDNVKLVNTRIVYNLISLAFHTVLKRLKNTGCGPTLFAKTNLVINSY